MRGYWISQTAKMNKHWQSGNKGSGETTWNPSNGCLYKVTKGGVDYYPAPSYCVLSNGAMSQEVFYNRQYSASGVAGIEISEEQVLEYVPYFPKSSDNYFIGTNLNTVSWEAKTDFDVVQYDSQETIVSFLTGENLASKNANLLKLTYAGYVLKKSGTATITQSEYALIEQALFAQIGNAKIDGRGHFTGSASQAVYPENMKGDFSAYPWTSQSIGFTTDFVNNRGFYSYSTGTQSFKYPAFTIQPQYYNGYYFSGVQKVETLVAPSIAPYIITGGYGMQGFAVDNGVGPTTVYDAGENARFTPIQILKKVEVIACPITG